MMEPIWNKIKQCHLAAAVLLCLVAASAVAQERLGPVTYNPLLEQAGNNAPASNAKTTAVLSLPFFEDFTGYSAYPDAAKWMDRQVYINNTMCVDPVSRGVATFDALNQYGLPYDTSTSANAGKTLMFADSLTSQYIDLSTYQPADSIYLSFFFQPQGNGFYPEPQDSLNLYLKRENGTWTRLWYAPGSPLEPFKQVMISIVDPNFFHDSFQFRFVNKASIFTNDDVWNVDYIRLDANRSLIDTFVNDVAFSIDPTNMLNDLTAMPYRQFVADKNKELASDHSATIRNNYDNAQNVNYGYRARESVTNTSLYTGSSTAINMTPSSSALVSFPMYNTNFTAAGNNDLVIFENTYYLQSPTSQDVKVNDTIVKEQVFHNYMAYDDGTAEKSYYLNLFSTLPGKLAVEYHLNQPDTLRGIAIYFGRQVPLATYKYFSATVYTDITPGGPGEQLVYQQDLLQPGYRDINSFYVYKFNTPVVLNAGKFYVGTIQPALSNSDSLYLGLDANRTMGNHVFYNVLDKWEPSTIQGAVMIRPLLGQDIFSSKVTGSNIYEADWSVFPNPATDVLYFNGTTKDIAGFELMDIQGRVLMTGPADNGASADISRLLPGMYTVRLVGDNGYSIPKRIIKL